MDGLDDIVNAINDILLAFEEAQSDFKTNLVVEAKNLDFLINEINGMVEQNRKQNETIKDDNLRNRWEQTNVDVSNAASRLAKLIRSMKGGVIERWAYSNLHDELKTILQNLIYQIQITDRVNVSVLMEHVKRTLDSVVRMKNCVANGFRSQSGAMNGLVLISREASKVALDLQINLRTRMAEMTDKELRGRLQDASEVIRTGMPVAISSCQRAIENPSTTSERDKALYSVLEALEEISVCIQLSSNAVSNFAMMFPLPPLSAKPEEKKAEPFDPSTLSRAPRVAQELNRLEDAVRRGDDKTAVSATKAFAEESQKQQAQARSAAELKRDPNARAQLLNDADQLQKLTPQIVAATKETLKNKADKTAQQNLFDKIDEAREVNARIEDAKKPEKALLALNRQLEKDFNDLAKYAKAGDVPKAAEMARKVADEMRQQVAIGRAFAETVKDPARKKEILDACDELDRLIAEIAKATKAVLENPNDQDALRRLDAVIDAAKAQGAKLTRAILEEQLARNKDDLFAKLANLYEAAKRGDRDAALDLLKGITDDINRRIELGRELAQQVKDPELKRQILKACDDLEKLLPELVLATQAVLADPNNPAALKRLKDVIEDIKNASERITAAKRMAEGQGRSSVRLTGSVNRGPDQSNADTTAEDIIALANSLPGAIANLRDALRRGDAKAAMAFANEVADILRKEAELGRRLAEQTSDPKLKKQILDAVEKLESLPGPIVQGVKDVLANPNDRSKMQKLDSLLNQAEAASKSLANLADKVRSSNKKLDDISNSMQKRMSSIDQPAMSEFRPDGSKDEIMVAAHQVRAAAKARVPVVLPEQKDLMAIASAIAAEMELLSKAAQTGNKKDMIASARKIADMISKIQSLSTEIGNKCKDPVLKKQLMAICRVPKNFSTQLKIISGVKAASHDDDPEAEAQLITCAQSLANSVVQTVKTAEAAALKC